jgi:hypothetical protein
MTANTIARAANDPQLQARVLALANREIIYNEDLANTEYGRALASGMALVGPLMYPIAVDTEAAYETAVNSGRGAPGYDIDVIPDAALTSAIVVHWPLTAAEKPDPDAGYTPIPPLGPGEGETDNTLPEEPEEVPDGD